MTKPAVTLLFGHGGGMCKEIWEPIVRRLRQSPLLRECTFDSFNFKYHGTRHDESVAPVVDLSDPQAPRVKHPSVDARGWASADLQEYTKATSSPGRVLIGIGHSLGSLAMWNTEVHHPGTFGGLVLFEPIYAPRNQRSDAVLNRVVAMTLMRESTWSSREAAREHVEAQKFFAPWDRESLAAYLRGGLMDNADGSVSLACDPKIEAAIYCNGPILYSDSELGRPKCKVAFEWGQTTRMFFPEVYKDIVDKHPQTYSLSEGMPECSHNMVVENPALAAANILRDLQGFPAFQQAPTHSKM